MKKAILIALSVLVATTTFVACGKKNEISKEQVTLKVVVPDGIPALSMSKLLKETKTLDKNVNIQFTIEKTTDSLTSKILSEDADIAIVPSNLAAQAYNKKLGYKIAAGGTWGSFFAITDDNINNISDLRGKELTTIGKGLTPDIVLRYILKEKGINADSDVKFNYLNGSTELAPNFISGKVKTAVVPEPMLSTILKKKSDTKILLDLNEEWKKLNSSENGYPQSSLIIKNQVAKDYKTSVDKFIDLYRESCEWTNTNPKELGDYVEELGIGVKKEDLSQALKRANIKFADAEDLKKDYNIYFKVLMENAPKTIGEKIPDDNAYYKK
ncbi:ABC transporter substrate-binding protein [Clostridium sp. 'White wine YQ']|uniref:ABC transporter substrate-binding protein n=1 Tax=Clostridium sp. 'White wine YQ' TaxID=3027474 RepID=UPI002366EA3B|nr:ABC transporter substrate-binding protein [Clostridium sp. 'White wine YQ']MDD7795836.1 ABC transporter substrate-binding protein [Clostridium sp. 'White wine YQ']